MSEQSDIEPLQAAKRIMVISDQTKNSLKEILGAHSDVPQIQAELNKLMEREGLPPGSILIVDDTPRPLELPDDIREWLSTVPKMTASDLEELRVAGEALPDFNSLGEWELYFAETDEGTTPVPESLVIGSTVLKFEEDLDEWQTDQAIRVGRLLSRMIEEAQELRRIAEIIVDGGDPIPGTADMGVKLSVRNREQLLRCIEKGYRIYFDHKAGIKFLRCPGRPDINYEL